MSRESIGKCLPLLVSSSRISLRMQRVGCADGLDSQSDEDNSTGQYNGASDSTRDGQPQRSRSSTPEIDPHPGTTGTQWPANGSKVPIYAKKYLSDATIQYLAPAVLCRLLPLYCITSDIPEEIIDYLFASENNTRRISLAINDLATERPVHGCLSELLWQTSYVDEICGQLIAIFGDVCEPDGEPWSRSALRSGQQKKRQSKLYDISWQMHENGKMYLQALPPFFFRQVLSRLAHFMCDNMHASDYHQYMDTLTHLLDVGWFKEAMSAIQCALEQVGAELSEGALHMQCWAEGPRLPGAGEASQQTGAVPETEMHYLVHKMRPDLFIPLEHAEECVRALRPNSPLNVRAYITIAASLERLAVAVLGSTDCSLHNFIHAEDAQLLLKRIASFDVFKHPFVLVPGAEVAMIRECARARQRAQLPITLCHAPYSATVFRRAMCSVCYQYIMALDKYQSSGGQAHFDSVYLWTRLFIWLFSHPLAQYHEAQATDTAQRLFNRSLSCVRRQITDAQADITSAITNGVANASIDAVSLALCLMYLCMALEGSEGAYRSNLNLIMKHSEPSYVQTGPPQKADEPGRKRRREQRRVAVAGGAHA